jgi:hypothetical protein
MEIWVLYDHPQDYPDSYVARKFWVDVPTAEIVISDSLQDLRHIVKSVEQRELTLIERSDCDAPCIVECWL